MSVFLTPDLEPITGGTYFPPTDSFGQLGFSSVLTKIATKVGHFAHLYKLPFVQWREGSAQIKEQGRELAQVIREGVEQAKSGAAPPSADIALKKCYDWLSKRFDSTNGGFGSAPKFPKEGLKKQMIY